MAEVLGVLASTAQLIDYTLRISAAISDIHARVQGGPELLKYAAQIQELLDTAAEIEQNHHLYSPFVLRRLDSVIEEARVLLNILEHLSANYTRGSLSRRYFKAAKGGRDEKRIIASFKRLEQEKTSLLFCIGVNNTEQLYSIDRGVRILVENTQNSEISTTFTMPVKETTETIMFSNECPHGHRAMTSFQHQNGKPCPACSAIEGGKLVPLPSSASNERGMRAIQNVNPQIDPPKTSDVVVAKIEYVGCTILGENNHAKQLNGNLGDSIVGINQFYKDCTVTGNGQQMNGSATGAHGMEVAKGFFAGFNGSVLPNGG